MSTRKTTVFYALLIAVASLAVGMVIASRLDLAPASSAQTMAVPSANSAPLSGPIDAGTFRTIAKAVSPAVVNIRTESRQRATELTEFFGGGDATQETSGFGITLSVLTSDIARRLRVPPDTEGVLVSDVEQGSPAFRAGIARGDVILQVNRKPVTSPQEAGRALGAVPSGSTAFLLVLRNGQQQFVTVRKE